MTKFVKRIVATALTAAVFATDVAFSGINVFAAGETNQTISAKDHNSVIIKTDGSLWAWGENSSAQLGTGTTDNIATPIQVMSGIESVSAAGSSILAVKTDGSLWALGYNGNGNLGDGTTKGKATPTKIMDGVKSVSASLNYTMIIKTDGSLWACGLNRTYAGSSLLGDGTTINRPTPVKIMDGVISVSAGTFHTVAVKTDGTLWTWGYNSTGALGDGTFEDKGTPVKIMGDVASASAGFERTMAIKTDGSLWAWGWNGYGQLGDGTTVDKNKPVKIINNVASVTTSGTDFTVLVKTDGSLWTCGRNWIGELGDGTTIDKTVPVKIMDGVVSVSSGSAHTIALKTDGSLWAWGYNREGQLGNGVFESYKHTTIPIKIMDGVKIPASADVTTPKERTNILNFNGVSSEIKLPIKNAGGRSMLPFRECAELLGARVSWNEGLKAASCELNGIKVTFIIGAKRYDVNGIEKTMDVAPFIDNGSTYIPIRYAAEGLGFKVDFKQTDTENIYIITK